MRARNLIFSIFTIIALTSCLGESSRHGRGSNTRSLSGFQNSQVEFKQICVCRDQNVLSGYSCESLCQAEGKTGEDRLVADMTLSPTLERDPVVQGSLYNWCYIERELATGGVNTNPKCELSYTTQYGATESKDVEIKPGFQNRFTAKINDLTDQIYVIKLQEIVSGEGSDEKQFRKTANSSGSILDIKPVHRYACMVHFNGAVTPYRLSFYFEDRVNPSPVPSSYIDILFCHNNQDPNQGLVDKINYPRLFEVRNALTMWDPADPLFTVDQEGKYRIEKEIASRTGLNSVEGIFYKIHWPRNPEFDGNETLGPYNPFGEEETGLGFAMNYWIDNTGTKQKVFCPTNIEYATSSNAVLNELGPYLNFVDTEALYLAERVWPIEAELPDGTKVPVSKNYMIIRESEMTKMWFYYEQLNGQLIPTAPKSNTDAFNKDMHFFWPFDGNRLTEKQEIYKVIHHDNANINPNVTDDKRVGCIPKR